jgi:microcystin degradation protein MlrC
MGLGHGLQSGQHRPLTCAIWSAKTDSTGPLGALLDAGVQNACFGPLVDPQTVLQLQGHAFGERVQIRLGGKTDPRFGGAPFALTCTLVSLSADGNCIGSRAMIGGLHCSWGPMAAVQVDGIEILVVEHPGADAEPAAVPGLRHRPCSQARGGAQIDAALFAGFEPIAGEVIVCDSGALCTLNYALLLYAKLLTTPDVSAGQRHRPTPPTGCAATTTASTFLRSNRRAETPLHNRRSAL